ncbi:MAG: hypothetical protein LBF12_00255 [Christensenellaceae bacterium]|nr:hypothetical protein [Christensenellaceae bacterium]
MVDDQFDQDSIKNEPTSVLSQEEIFTAHALSPFGELFDLPFAWHRDMPVVMSSKEKKAELKRQKALNNYIKEQTVLRSKMNIAYKQKINNYKNEFEKWCTSQEEIFNIKIEEMELAAKENQEILKSELLEKEDKLKLLEKNKEELLVLKKNEERIRRKQLILLGVFDDLREEFAIVNEKITRNPDEIKVIKDEYYAVRNENLNRSKAHPELPISLVNENDNEGKSKYTIKVRNDDSGGNDLIEIKGLSFKRDRESLYIIKDLQIPVRPGSVTIIYSESEDKLIALKQILFKNYPSDSRVVDGFVRIVGIDIGIIGRDEYRTTIGQHIIEIGQIKEHLMRVQQSLHSIYKGTISDIEFKKALALFSLHQKFLTTKPTLTNEFECSLMALVALIASSNEIKILALPEACISSECINHMAKYLNNFNYADKAALILTSSYTIVDSVKKAKVYKI